MIKKIKWDNYRSLGNLELDFTKADGSLYNTIVLAGDNGTGKTTILNSLATFLNLDSFEAFTCIEHMIDRESYVLTKLSDGDKFGFHNRLKVSDGSEKAVQTNRNNNVDNLKNDSEDIRYYGFSYSRAKTGFRTQPIQSSKTEMLDSGKQEDDSGDDYTRIKQLLVDISEQDDSEWMKLCEKENGSSPVKFAEFKRKSRMYRFKMAFEDFFDDLKFTGIETNVGEKKIMFSKYENPVDIDSLSTGEKQIVFRGAHLLRNSKNIEGGFVFIDEPELSMHPNWQKRILNYYRKLFNSNGKQSVQMIIATHSTYVIQEALKYRDDVLVVVLSVENGSIKAEKVTAPNVLPYITEAETNYLAFHVPTVDYHIELYGWLQNKINNASVKACDDYITQQLQYDPGKHGKASSHRNTQYLTLPTYIRNAIDHPDPSRLFTEDELRTSIELLIELCR